MNKLRHDEIDPRLVPLLEELRPAPERNPKLAARTRAQFLAEAVSVRNEQRLSLWTIFQQKEQFAMKLIMSMLVIAGLLFGGNATVSAAQNDLPNEPLYPVKLMSEEMRLWLKSDPVAKIEMLMEQAQTRTQEMAALVENGVMPPAELRIHVQERIQRALQLAANLDEPALTTTRQRIQAQLQTQEQLMSQLQDGTCVECEPVLQQTREMLRTQLRQMESGLDQPQTVPYQNQNQNQNQIRTTQTPVAVDEPGLPKGSSTPALNGTGQQNGNGNPSAATPMPKNNSTNQDGGMQNGPDNSNNSENGNDDGGGNENGSGDGGGNGSGDGSGQGSGGQDGKP